MVRLIILLFVGLSILGYSNIHTEHSKQFKALLSVQDTIPVSHTVKIDSLFNYYFDGIKVDSSEVSTKLEQANKTEGEMIIGLKAHKSVVLNRVISIMDICKDLNIKIRVISE